MRTITQTLNMAPGGVPPVIHVSQYDSDFTITFTLFSLFGGFTIESGTTAQIRGTKASGTGYSADAAINISAKTVTVTGNQQMTAVAGQNIFEIVLKKNNKEISSKNFVLHVERAALDADTITDDTVLRELNAIIEGVETATRAADRAEAAAASIDFGLDSVPTQGSTNAVQSGGVYSALQDVKNGLPEIRTPDETEADLYIGDSDGNVLAKLASGAIETKNFKGFQYITYKSESVTYSTLPLTLTVNHKFKKGDRVVLHVDRGAMPWDYGAYVNYYEDDRSILVGKRIDSAWIEHVITEDTDAIVATYTGQPSTAGMTVGDVYTLEVSLLGDIPIKPTVVTVKKDGTGDYTTLRGALDAIGTKANDVLNPYRIEIYAGTYDVMDDYTDEEISAAVYDQISFVGPKLLNGMYLVGIGAPNEVVLNGELDTTKFSSTIRGDISTLNCQGSCGFENLTVIANHLRYCVHDDFHTTIGKKPKRIVKDCNFRGYDISYNPGTTYGAGTSDSGCDYEFENCDFGENAGVHTLPTIAQKSFIHLVNCKGHGFRIGDQETSDPVDGYSIYQFDNCDFLWINHNMSDNVPHVIVRGSGNGSPIYQFPAATLYDTGDVVAMRNGGFSQTCNVGEVTEWYSNAGHGPRFRKATSVNGASGIVVYKDANDTYIQTKGYVCTDRTALTTFALGDYIGIENSLPVVVSDASDAIGRIAYIDNSGNGYIKLNFGG